jgi:ATP-binding cassette subfamily B protein
LAFTPILPSAYRQDPSAVRGATFNWSVFRRMLRLSRRRWRLVVVLMSLVVTGSLLTLIPPLLFRQIIDHDIPAGSTSSIVGDGLLAFAAFSAGLLLLAAGHLVAAYLSTGVILDIRHALFDKFQKLPHLFFTRAHLGMVTSRFMNDVTNAQQLITVTFGSALGTVVTIASTLVVMAVLSWQVTLFGLIAIPAFVIPSLLLSRRVQVAARDQMQRFGELTSFLNERFDVHGSMLVKLYSRHDHEKEAFGERAKAIRANGIRLTFLTQSMALTTALIGIGGVVATYIYGGIQAAHGALTIGTMVALSTYILQAATPVFALSNVRSTFLQGPSFARANIRGPRHPRRRPGRHTSRG